MVKFCNDLLKTQAAYKFIVGLMSKHFLASLWEELHIHMPQYFEGCREISWNK
jgi:hypothetical protein